mgnify:CR=1 FL=1
MGEDATRRPEFVLLMRCRDEPGLLARVSGFLYDRGGDIRDAAQYGDPTTGLFFVRIHFRMVDGADGAALHAAFAAMAQHIGIDWELHDAGRPCRVVIAVSKMGHCLNDLLHRWSINALPIKVAAVVSNHEAQRDLTHWHGVPYHYLPVTSETKVQQERQIRAILTDCDADLLVLARYMQILSPDLCRWLEGRAINIHHSFLPSFKGAKPYHRAHERGVKLIGATAHYVTPDLDEGPIIEQDVRRVTHAHTPDDLVALGRETEAQVLARAVSWHAQHRIMLDGHKTVVFS